MPLDRVKANELLDLVVGQSAQGRELLLDKLEECWVGVTLNADEAAIALTWFRWRRDGHDNGDGTEDDALADRLVLESLKA